MSSPGDLSAGQLVGAGRYQLIRMLGKGGMGVVWLARDNRLEEEVALKFLAGEISHDTEALSDMRRETLKSRRLSHPNIIRIHDLYESSDEMPFISMEYIEGKALNALKAEQPQMLFTWEYLRPLVQQLCSALDYAHGQKIIHRDLKPGNMMVTAEGTLKLADFGIAASASDSISRLTRNMGSSGTPAYMSPQQMSSQSPKVSDDIYALGATLYELLTSKPPFYRGDIYRQVREEPPTPLEERLADLELSNDIPGGVGALIMACLAKEPAQRPPSAAAVADWIGLDIATRRQGAGLASVVEGRPENVSVESDDAAQVANMAAQAAHSQRKWWIGLAAGVITLMLALAAMSVLKRAPRGNHRAAPEGQTSMSSEPSAESPQSPVQPAVSKLPVSSESNGWVSLFNGTDLTGWDGDPEIWSVQDGIIVGDTTGKVFTRFYSYLFFKNKEFDDFELRAMIRMPEGNTGIQFRAQDAGNWMAKGYQHDIVPPDSPLLGCMTYDNAPSGIRPGSQGGIVAKLGEKVEWDAGGKSRITGSTGVTAKSLQAQFDRDGWNEYSIIAKDNHFILKINGLTTSELTENDPAYATTKGLIALQTHKNKNIPMRVEFKDIRIRPLAGNQEAQSAQSQPASAPGDWTPMLAGNSFTDWTPDKTAQWKIENGVVTGTGPRTHLRSTQNFTNLALKVEAKAEPGANGGIYFRVSGTRAGNLPGGYEAQVDRAGDRYPTGSLYNIRTATEKLVNETEWFEVNIVAIGSRIVIRVNDRVTVDYTDPARKYSAGGLALQSMVAAASVSYRNLRVKHLPEYEDAAWEEALRTDPELRAQLGGR